MQDGDRVRAGERLTYGPPDPHDMLRILGREAVQHHLMRELQWFFRALRRSIDDKHIEVVASRMIGKVKVKAAGDSGLRPDAVIDRMAFEAANERLGRCWKITEAGDSGFTAGEIVPREAFDARCDRLAGEGKALPAKQAPRAATCSELLLGISRAAAPSESFLSAAAFHETTRVLTEAALAGKVDRLVGLKENVLLGRLVPAGTGFPTHQDAEVRVTTRATEGGAF